MNTLYALISNLASIAKGTYAVHNGTIEFTPTQTGTNSRGIYIAGVVKVGRKRLYMYHGLFTSGKTDLSSRSPF